MDLVFERPAGTYRHAVLIEERLHERIGVADDGVGDAHIDEPIQPEDGGHRRAGGQRGDHLREVVDQQLAQVLDLLDDLPGG